MTNIEFNIKYINYLKNGTSGMDITHNQVVLGSSPSGTTNKIKPLQIVEAFLLALSVLVECT
jgi:hypothetical protein